MDALARLIVDDDVYWSDPHTVWAAIEAGSDLIRRHSIAANGDPEAFQRAIGLFGGAIKARKSFIQEKEAIFQDKKVSQRVLSEINKAEELLLQVGDGIR
jgi:hypothetical protein